MVLFGISLREANFDRLPLFIGLLIASMVSGARFKVRLPMMTNLSTMSGSCAADFASLLLLGPPLTMLVTAAGAWSQSTFHTRSTNPLYRKLFNIASLGITIQAAGLAYRLAGGSFGHVSWPDAATPLLAATLVYFVVNTGTVAIAVALSTGQSTVRVWLHDFTWGAPSYFMAAGAAAVVAVVVDRSLYGFLPLAMAPIYLTYRGYQTYAGRLEDERRHREVIESLNEGMFVLRYDGSVELWNDALERITGINRHEVLNHQLCDAVPGFLQTSVPDAVRDTLQGGAPVILQHIEFQAGDTTRVLVRAAPAVYHGRDWIRRRHHRPHARRGSAEAERRAVCAGARRRERRHLGLGSRARHHVLVAPVEGDAGVCTGRIDRNRRRMVRARSP